MKKLIVAVLSIATLGLSGTAVANATQDANPGSPGSEVTAGGSLATETINDIAIPTEVLIYVQTKYQGYAVTQASKTTRDGKPAYSLRVDPNDISTDYDGFYLLYGMDWKLLGEEKMAPPPAPRPKPQSSDEKKPSSEPTRNETRDRKPPKPRHDN